MQIYTVSFFGHRQLSDIFSIERKLKSILSELINTKEYIEFLVGRDGDFNQLVSSTIREIVNAHEYGNTSHILVLPYERAVYRDNMDSFMVYYDEVEICPQSAKAHFKAAIGIRNRAMIDRSDLIICMIEHKSGGAATAVKYVEKQGKRRMATGPL